MFLQEAISAKREAMRVLIVDDHQAFAQSLGQYLERQEGIDVVEIAGSADEAVVVIGEREPAVVLMDYGLGSNGVMTDADATRMIKRVQPDARVVIITCHDDRGRLMDALDAGAIGWISNSVWRTSSTRFARPATVVRRSRPPIPRASSVVAQRSSPTRSRRARPRSCDGSPRG
jgi:DNA-binding NarL/FixJ family response regulator